MSTLIVPIELDALVIDAASQNAQPFRRWRFDYPALADYASPEPEFGQGEESTEPPPLGVHLHWSLPEALRHGTQSTAGGSIDFPAVPNRWLVVRLSGQPRAACGWVIESDCPEPEATALYLLDPEILAAWLACGDPERSQRAKEIEAEAGQGPFVTGLGKAFELEGWSERAAEATFLTAVAPGNASFAAYHPHSAEVFGFHDPLEGIDADTLSYMVMGWYSSPADDVLAKGPALGELGWSVAKAPAAAPTTSLHHGIALDVPWNRAATEPPPSPLDSLADSVHVAIGGTVVDAFTALVANQLASSGKAADAAQVELLQAFQHGLLPELEQIAGQELLRLAVHQAAFDSRPGGYRWTIAAEEGETGTMPEPPPWLASLNQAQASLDEAQLALASLQGGLYAVWWKFGRGVWLSQTLPDGLEEFEAEEKTYKEKLLELEGLTAKASATVDALLAGVPQPVFLANDTGQQAFEGGIAKFASEHGLAEGVSLKALAGPRLWRAGDPALVLSGIEPAPLPDPDTLLDCRLSEETVTAFTGVGDPPVNAAALGSALPTLPLPADVPKAAAALLTELFLLDPRSAAAIAAAAKASATTVTGEIEAHASSTYSGTLPALGLSSWSEQPWAPLMMEWQVAYVHIPFESDGKGNWSFDGCDYHYNYATGGFGPFEADGDAPIRRIGGIAPLTAEAQLNFGSRLSEFIANYVRPDPQPPASLAELERLEEEVEELDRWRFMSQRLSGLGDLIALRDTRAQTAPNPALAAKVEGQTAAVPYLEGAGEFEGAAMGQIALEALIVYDKFGQVLEIVGGTGRSASAFAPSLDPNLVPDAAVIEENPQRFAQLRPRLLQHARLDFELVDASDDQVYRSAVDANPLGGWLLPNHLDGSLGLYAPDGTALGELSLLEDTAGTKTTRWIPPPNSTLTEADLATEAPLLAAMAGAEAIRDPNAFGALLDAIDSTLWTIDPLGDRADQNLSVLIGRPLALVRVRLALTLDGEPIADMSSWKTTWPPPQPDFTGFDFPIRLGDSAMRQDGLIGYFSGDEYGTFNSVQPAAAGVAQSYVQQIGPVGQIGGGNYPRLRCDGTSEYLTLLVDPRAGVHAISGILPAKELALPPDLVGAPLTSLAVAFRTGPLLTALQPSPGTGEQPPAHPLAISLPLPAERNGSWEWWEASVETPAWTSYDLVQSSPDAQLLDLPSTLREGYLQLRIDLGK